MVFELAAYPYLDDFTLWSNDGPIMVEIELFAVSAVQDRGTRGRKMGTRNFARANSRASRAAMCARNPSRIGAKDGWSASRPALIVSFEGRTTKQAPTLLVSQEMAA